MTDAQQAKSDREALLARLEQAEARVKELEAELSLIYASEGAAPGPAENERERGEPVAWHILNEERQVICWHQHKASAEKDVATYYAHRKVTVEPLYAQPDPAVECLRRELEGARAKLREAEDDAHMYLERVNQNAYAGQSEEMWQASAIAAEASLAKAREALKPLAAEQLSTEYEVRDLVKVFPAEELRRRAQAVEARDRAILAARSILGDQPT